MPFSDTNSGIAEVDTTIPGRGVRVGTSVGCSDTDGIKLGVPVGKILGREEGFIEGKIVGS